jgi:hypothetical protein
MLVTIRVPDFLLRDREIRSITVALEGRNSVVSFGAVAEKTVGEAAARAFAGKCGKCGKPERAWHHCDEFRCEAPLIEREIA